MASLIYDYKAISFVGVHDDSAVFRLRAALFFLLLGEPSEGSQS